MTRFNEKLSHQSPRRDKFEIWSGLMEACLYTIRTQSWLMRKLGLNTSTIKESLDILTKGGLLEQLEESDLGRFVYKTTEKGKATLKQYYGLVSQFFGAKDKH